MKLHRLFYKDGEQSFTAIGQSYALDLIYLLYA